MEKEKQRGDSAAMNVQGSAREVALLTLSACEKQGAWSDGYLKRLLSQYGLDSRDAALATRLCFGVLQNRLQIDFYLAAYTAVPLEKMEDKVLNVLRLGAYQLLFLSRIPQSAAVNESVKLAHKYSKNPRSAALVNAVLRTIIRNKDTLPKPAGDDPIGALAVSTSHPKWLVREWVDLLGVEEAGQLLRADNEQPPMAAQVNTCKVTERELLCRLQAEGVTAQQHPWLPDCLFLSDTGNLEGLQTFQEGCFYIQDPAARLAVLAAKPQAGMCVLDACSAPGGKSFAAAIAMKDMGEIIACDIHPHKERLIRAGARRLGLNIVRPMTQDGKTDRPDWHGKFDLVIADVPCSGLGIIRKKPDIRYKDPAALDGLPEIQYAIMCNVAQYVRRGGVLLYATCTLRRQENEGVVERFVVAQPDFCLEPFELPGKLGRIEEGMLTLWPHRHGTDGFFFAKLRRQGMTEQEMST